MDKFKYQVVEQINIGLSIYPILKECKEKGLDVCNHELLLNFNNERLWIQTYGQWANPDAAENNKEKIRHSLTVGKTEKVEGFDFHHLEGATEHICENNPWTVAVGCEIDRRNVQTIMAKDVANLTKLDIRTLLGLQEPVRYIIEDRALQEPGNFLDLLTKHFETLSLNEWPKELFDKQVFQKAFNKFKEEQIINMAMHKVLAVNVAEQLKEMEKTGDPKKLTKKAEKIMEGVDNLPGLVMVCAMDDMNPLSQDRAVEILAKEVEGTNVLDNKKMKLTSCDGVFWLMCTVHNYEVPSMENVTEVPTNREIISASMGFKRFYNNLAINKTDD